MQSARTSIWVIAAMFALAAHAAGAAQWYVDGKPAPASPDRGRAGDFSVVQLATDDLDAFYAAWAVKTPGARVETTTKTLRNKQITTYLIFAGCAPAPDGKCNVTADFEVTGPDGKHYSSQADVPVWRAAAPAKNVLQLSEGGLGLRIEDGEALGAYRVKAVTTDHVAGIILSTEQIVTVSEAK